MLNLARWIETFVSIIGRCAAWLGLGTVLICFAVVVLRKGFSLGWVAMQEAYVDTHAAAFMLCAAWVLISDGHVRVDVWYRGRSRQTKAWVDLLGSLCLLLPTCAFLTIYSFDYVVDAWRLREGSPEPGGLPGVFLIKTLIPASALLLALAGLAQVLKSAASLSARSGA